jgi:hypothetical protein
MGFFMLIVHERQTFPVFFPPPPPTTYIEKERKILRMMNRSRNNKESKNYIKENEKKLMKI